MEFRKGVRSKRGVFRGVLRQKKGESLSPRGGVRRVILDVVFRMVVVRITKQQRAKFRVDRRRFTYRTGGVSQPQKGPPRLGP